VIRLALLLALALVSRSAAARIIPEAYELTLAPDAAHGSFSGEEEVELTLDAATRVLGLDAVELEVSSASAVVDGVVRPLRVRRRAQAVELMAATPLPRGRVKLRLRFAGRLGVDLTGLYANEVDGRRYVFSQLEPRAARRVFPCIDEPALRARFTLHVVIDGDEQAISNGPVIAELPADDGHKLVTFAPTPPLPTYLISLAIGRFEEQRGQAGVVPVRVLTTPGHASAAAAALRDTVELIAAFERYLGVPFPFAKLDVVAVPHMGPHAMENAGAIFVRADELLGESPVERRLTARRLAHELAHQWFGDLVTVAAWNDLWLSEGLARWAEFEILDRTHADWRVREEFRGLRDRAIHLDDRARSHAIRPHLLRENHPAFDAITYDKGAATVRMLQVWMGDEAFRAALRRYLGARAWGAATSEDFWSALGGAEVSAMARTWFERRGHPSLLVDVRCARGAVDVRLHKDGHWDLPLVLRTATTTLHLVMRHARASLRLREPGGCAALEIEDRGELPIAIRDVETR
jgi:alanyl aminopeptidase